MLLKNVVRQLFTKRKQYSVKGNYLQYGNGDDYPFLLVDLRMNSSTLAMCIETKAKITAGAGGTELDWLKVGSKSNVYDLVCDIAYQLAQFNGFVCLCGYEFDKQTLSLRKTAEVMPFELFRYTNDSLHTATIFKVSETAGYEVGKEYFIFQSFEEADKAVEEGFLEKTEKWLYVDTILTSQAFVYPRASYNAVLRDALIEKELKQAKLRDVQSGFSARTIFTIYQDSEATAEQKTEDVQDLEGLCGAEGATIMIRYARNKESKMDVDTIANQSADKLYEYTERSVRENIMRAFQIPEELYGIPIAGKLGGLQEMNERLQYTQKYVVRHNQRLIEKFFYQVLGIDYKITNLTL